MIFKEFISKTGRDSIGVYDDGNDKPFGYINWDRDADGNIWITFLHIDKNRRGGSAALGLLKHFHRKMLLIPESPLRFYAHVCSRGVLKLCTRVFGKPLSEVVAEDGMDVSFLPAKAEEVAGTDGCDAVHCPITYLGVRMSRRRRLIDKELTKRVAGCCRICKRDIYAILDCHRIQGGNADVEYVNLNEYVDSNTVVLCANCHRSVHDGIIVIHRWVHSTAGRLLWISRNGIEEFL